MNEFLGNLGDCFPDSEKKCRIRGCNNILHISGERALRNVAEGMEARPELMCRECSARFNELTDKELPCAKEGCDGKWIWRRWQQLEAEKCGHKQEPRGYCDKCRSVLKGLGEQQLPCRIHGCHNTWTWTPRMQMESKNGKPPRRLCNECFELLKTLEDKELPCRIKNCKGKFLWTKMMQLEHLREGKKLENAPQRLCPECMEKAKTLSPIEQKCRIQGCENTWMFGANEQLEAWRKAGDEENSKIPERMCKSCYDFFQTTQDKTLKCRNNGCENTWVWTRHMQLGAFAHNHGELPREPLRMCNDCMAKLNSMQDIEQPCRQNGCKGHWIYKREEQLRDQLVKRPVAQRLCNECSDFLKNAEKKQIVCEKCGATFDWTVHEQLNVKLGAAIQPTKCAACVAGEINELVNNPPPAPVVNEELHGDNASSEN